MVMMTTGNIIPGNVDIDDVANNVQVYIHMYPTLATRHPILNPQIYLYHRP